MQAPLFEYAGVSNETATIRLIKINPGEHDEVIRIKLWHVPLEKAKGKYDAISYTWGEPAPLHAIWINDCQLFVRSNIWHCLRHLRKTIDQSRPAFWIDSICIDQDNTAEKNQQVALMGRIFQNAAQVLVWLGTFSEREHTSGTFGDPHSGEYARSVEKAHTGHPVWGSCCCGDCEVYRMTQDDYWNRVWIVQEVVLAYKSARIIAGHLSVSFLRMVELYHNSRLLNYPDEMIGVPPRRVVVNFSTMNSLNSRQEKTSMQELVRLFRDQSCSDFRDKIYGFRGTANNCSDLKIDYTCDAEDLFLRTLTSYHNTRKLQPFGPTDVSHLMKALKVTSDSLHNFKLKHPGDHSLLKSTFMLEWKAGAILSSYKGSGQKLPRVSAVAVIDRTGHVRDVELETRRLLTRIEGHSTGQHFLNGVIKDIPFGTESLVKPYCILCSLDLGHPFVIQQSTEGVVEVQFVVHKNGYHVLSLRDEFAATMTSQIQSSIADQPGWMFRKSPFSIELPALELVEYVSACKTKLDEIVQLEKSRQARLMAAQAE